MKRFLRIILAVCLCLSFVLLVTGCAKEKEKKKEEAFSVPKGYVSVIQVTINPTVNLYLDENQVILAVEYVNTDAKECYEKIEKKLVGAELDKGVNLVVQKAAEEGYFKEKKEISIDIIETKQEEKKNTVLKVATSAAKDILQEKEIEVEVKILTEGKKITEQELEDAVKAESAEQTDTDKSAEDKATTDKAVADKAAADKAAADKAAADKAAAEERDKKNPQKNLKKGTQYKIYKLKPDGEVLEYAITFSDNEYSYRMTPYWEQRMESDVELRTITYNGKTYYECGGGGGGGTYSLTTEKITMKDGLNMVLTMTIDGKLVVETMNENSDFFVVGDVISP